MPPSSVRRAAPRSTRTTNGTPASGCDPVRRAASRRTRRRATNAAADDVDHDVGAATPASSRAPRQPHGVAGARRSRRQRDQPRGTTNIPATQQRRRCRRSPRPPTATRDLDRAERAHGDGSMTAGRWRGRGSRSRPGARAWSRPTRQAARTRRETARSPAQRQRQRTHGCAPRLTRMLARRCRRRCAAIVWARCTSMSVSTDGSTFASCSASSATSSASARTCSLGSWILMFENGNATVIRFDVDAIDLTASSVSCRSTCAPHSPVELEHLDRVAAQHLVRDLRRRSRRASSRRTPSSSATSCRCAGSRSRSRCCPRRPRRASAGRGGRR